MKKIISLFIAFILALVITTPRPAEAAVKISKKKATLEVDATLKLKITGTKSKATWKSNNKSVATVDKNGLVTAVSEGQATITATVDSKKYTCVVTVVDSNKDTSKSSITTSTDFEDYLNSTYSSINTPMGKIQFKHRVSENKSEVFAYDFYITTEWEGLSPYDIEYSSSYSSSDKDKTKNKLKDIQKSIYNDFIAFFPSKKAMGGYCQSWYEYPTLKVGYNSIRFLSWCNYDDSDDVYAYKTSKISDFKWIPNIDDYDFTK